MENLIIPFIATALVLIVSLLFNMQKNISHLDKKIDVNSAKLDAKIDQQVGLINAKIDEIIHILQKDSTNANQRIERLENRFDSGVPLKIKETKR